MCWIERYGSNPPLILAQCMHNDAPASGVAGLSSLACFRPAEKKAWADHFRLLHADASSSENLVSVEGFPCISPKTLN